MHFQKVVLGNAVTLIDADAIGNMNDEKYVHYLEIHTIEPPKIESGTEVDREWMFGSYYNEEAGRFFSNLPTAIKVPETAVAEYKTTEPWSLFYNYISAID